MSLNTTTLSGAITAYQTQIGLTSATGVTAPVSTTGSGATYLYCEAEMMFVTAVSGTFISVIRGVLGTQAVAHSNLVNVVAGLVTDFPNFTPQIAAFQTLAPNRFQGISLATASAATIVAPGPIFHVTGTTATNIITPPANFVEGSITIIADGIWTFTSSAVTNGIAQSGTVTTANSAISFYYDANTALWYPSRLA